MLNIICDCFPIRIGMSHAGGNGRSVEQGVVFGF